MLTDTVVVGEFNASHNEVPIGVFCIPSIELRHEQVELGLGEFDLYAGCVLETDGESEITLLRSHHIDVVLHEYGVDLRLVESISLLYLLNSVCC